MSLRRRVPTLGWVITVAIASLIGLSAQTANPLNGTWRTNLAKSTFSPANLAVKSSTSKFEVTQGGIKLVNDGVDAQGRATHLEYTAQFDGKDYPVKATIDGRPSPNQDAVAWKKIDDYAYENTAKLKGQALTTTRVVISRDGKTRTNTVTGKNAQGQTVNNTQVYEKQ
jgi:hypothetical protein